MFKTLRHMNSVALPSASVALPMALYKYVYDMIWTEYVKQTVTISFLANRLSI